MSYPKCQHWQFIYPRSQVLPARHASMNQERQKRRASFEYLWRNWEDDLFSGLSKITETAHLCSFHNMQLSVKFSFTQLSLNHLFSKHASLPLCFCAVQCKSSGCIYVVSVLSVPYPLDLCWLMWKQMNRASIHTHIAVNQLTSLNAHVNLWWIQISHSDYYDSWWGGNYKNIQKTHYISSHQISWTTWG